MQRTLARTAPGQSMNEGGMKKKKRKFSPAGYLSTRVDGGGKEGHVMKVKIFKTERNGFALNPFESHQKEGK